MTSNTQPPSDTTRAKIVQAATLLARGRSLRETAVILEIEYRRLVKWRRVHADVWQTALNMSAMDFAKTREGEYNPEPEPEGPMLLTQYVRSIYLPSRVEVSFEYGQALIRTAERLCRFAGKALRVTDLNEQLVAAWLTDVRQRYSAVTTNNYRRQILTIWVAAFDDGYYSRPPRKGRIRRVRQEEQVPEAWTSDECQRILEQAQRWPGEICGIPANLWWTSLLLVVYYTGARIGGVTATQVADYRPGEGVYVKKQKNRRAQWYQLPAEVCQVIDAMLQGKTDGPLWPWDRCRESIFRTFRLMIFAAQVPHPPGGRELFHRMRRTTLSYCALVDPGLAQRQGGHSSYQLTQRHYVDPRIAGSKGAAVVIPQLRITPALPAPEPAPVKPDATDQTLAAAMLAAQQYARKGDPAAIATAARSRKELADQLRRANGDPLAIGRIRAAMERIDRAWGALLQHGESA